MYCLLAAQTLDVDITDKNKVGQLAVQRFENNVRNVLTRGNKDKTGYIDLYEKYKEFSMSTRSLPDYNIGEGLFLVLSNMLLVRKRNVMYRSKTLRHGEKLGKVSSAKSVASVESGKSSIASS